jgi:hypothetical protein
MACMELVTTYATDNANLEHKKPRISSRLFCRVSGENSNHSYSDLKLLYGLSANGWIQPSIKGSPFNVQNTT